MPLNQRGQVGEIEQINRISPLASGPLEQIDHSTSGTAVEQVDSYAVPDGHRVVIQALDGNDGTVYVGDSDTQQWALAPRESIAVYPADTGDIHTQTPTAGDGIVLMWRDQ